MHESQTIISNLDIEYEVIIRFKCADDGSIYETGIPLNGTDNVAVNVFIDSWAHGARAHTKST
jgi:hypothetical protein